MREICIELKDYKEMEKQWHNIRVKDLTFLCHEGSGENMVEPITVALVLLNAFKIEGKWAPNHAEERAAWELYVEIITRISVAELKPDEGFLREALTSLYTLFNTTRQILREHGLSVAQPKKKFHLFREDEITLGYLAVAILNRELRPILAKWHPLLADYEYKRTKEVSPLEHERNWEHAQELRKILNETRLVLIEYADLLAKAAKVPSLIVERQ